MPFAVFQLVSGTIGERLGRRRVVRTGYVAYAISSVAAALAPTIGLFIVARAASGTANAFLTPLLLAGLAEVTERERLGRAVGTFAAVQTAAIALAPAVGGVLGEIDWRLAFLAPGGGGRRARLRPAARRPAPRRRRARAPAGRVHPPRRPAVARPPSRPTRA